ncbi:hypothetical protein DIPPA_34205 [Diplonema papillatum]|nr:hypothetical protein DIPPA_34205 [Diplonema papillatum]
MEASPRDYYRSSSLGWLVRELRAAGAGGVAFSCAAECLKLETFRPSLPGGSFAAACFEPAGLVVTDTGAVFIVRNDAIVVTLPRPTGHLRGTGSDNLMHLAPEGGSGWDILLEVPAERIDEAKASLEEKLEPEDNPIDVGQLVQSKYPWLASDVKRRLGLVVREARAVAGSWRDQHKAAHTRKMTELEVLRSRSRSRDRTKRGGSASPPGDPRSPSAEQSQGEDDELRRLQEFERQAQDRLSQQQHAIEEDRARRRAAMAARAAVLRAGRDEAAAEAALVKSAADSQHMAELHTRRAAENQELDRQRRQRQEADRVVMATRQEEEARQAVRKEKLRLERLATEDEHRQEMVAAKAKQAEEERSRRELMQKRYDQSQVHRRERQGLNRDEEAARLDVVRESAAGYEALADHARDLLSWTSHACALATLETEETFERSVISNDFGDSLSRIVWQCDRSYAHACEVGRRKLMEEEERSRRTLFAHQEAAMVNITNEYLNNSDWPFASPFEPDPLDDESDNSAADFNDNPHSLLAMSPLKTPPGSLLKARISDVVTVYCEDDGSQGEGGASPHRATQTPSYTYEAASGLTAENDSAIAEQLLQLRRELNHERELRDRTAEKIAGHERQMNEKARQLEERERKLLAQLAVEHAKRLEEVRGAVEPAARKAEAFEETDRMLAAMNEREAEWAAREKEWRVHQADLEREAARIRDELARATELHWLAENDRSELKGRCDANEVEMASMRNTIDRADARLRAVLIEEQELLCKVERQWKDRVADAEKKLVDTEGRLRRKTDERERYWLREERNLRARCERAEAERKTLAQKLEEVRVKTDAGDSEKRKLRQELSAEGSLAARRWTAEARAARADAEREKKARVQAEAALRESEQHNQRLSRQLEEANYRLSQHLQDSQLAAAMHAAELERVQKLVPTQPTSFTVLVALETASRYSVLAQWHEGCTFLIGALLFKETRLAAAPSKSLDSQNTMLRELLRLEEEKVGQLERTIDQLQTQRGELSRHSKWSVSLFAELELREAEHRLSVEEACRDELVTNLTAGSSQKRAASPNPRQQQPQPPAPQQARSPSHTPQPPLERVLDPLGDCSGWLLASIEASPVAPTVWKQLYMWIDGDAGMLCHAPTDPRKSRNAPVSSISLAKVFTVEIEMFVDALKPPPVSKYQQLGFYIETDSGLKHRFCASTVAERTEWLDQLRRVVLRQSAGVVNAWNAHRFAGTPDSPSSFGSVYPPPASGERHPMSSTAFPRRTSRERSRTALGPKMLPLEHLSFMAPPIY